MIRHIHVVSPQLMLFVVTPNPLEKPVTNPSEAGASDINDRRHRYFCASLATRVD